MRMSGCRRAISSTICFTGVRETSRPNSPPKFTTYTFCVPGGIGLLLMSRMRPSSGTLAAMSGLGASLASSFVSSLAGAKAFRLMSRTSDLLYVASERSVPTITSILMLASVSSRITPSTLLPLVKMTTSRFSILDRSCLSIGLSIGFSATLSAGWASAGAKLATAHTASIAAAAKPPDRPNTAVDRQVCWCAIMVVLFINAARGL